MRIQAKMNVCHSILVLVNIWRCKHAIKSNHKQREEDRGRNSYNETVANSVCMNLRQKTVYAMTPALRH